MRTRNWPLILLAAAVPLFTAACAGVPAPKFGERPARTLFEVVIGEFGKETHKEIHYALDGTPDSGRGVIRIESTRTGEDRTYTGELQHGLFHGRGRLVYDERPGSGTYFKEPTTAQEFYEGGFRYGQPHGRGVWQYRQAAAGGAVLTDRYEGEFYAGNARGEGVRTLTTEIPARGVQLRHEFAGYHNQKRLSGQGVHTRWYGDRLVSRMEGVFLHDRIQQGRGTAVLDDDLEFKGAYGKQLAARDRAEKEAGTLAYQHLYDGEVTGGYPHGQGAVYQYKVFNETRFERGALVRSGRWNHGLPAR